MRSIGAWLRRRAENVAAAMLAVMFAAFVVQIAFRYFFNLPTGWSSELAVILWLWLVLWGAAFVVKESEAIRFDLLSGKAPVTLPGADPFAGVEARGARVFVARGASVDPSARLLGPVLVGPGAVVEAAAVVGPGVD